MNSSRDHAPIEMSSSWPLVQVASMWFRSASSFALRQSMQTFQSIPTAVSLGVALIPTVLQSFGGRPTIGFVAQSEWVPSSACTKSPIFFISPFLLMQDELFFFWSCSSNHRWMPGNRPCFSCHTPFLPFSWTPSAMSLLPADFSFLLLLKLACAPDE